MEYTSIRRFQRPHESNTTGGRAHLRTSINTLIARFALLVAGCLVATTVNAVVIQRVNLDGSGLTPLVTNSSIPGLIALDVAGGQMSWTDAFDSVQRANLDGLGLEDLVTGLTTPTGIALDLDAGHIYFTSLVPLPASLWLFGIARRRKAA